MTCLDEQRHGYESDDYVTFSEVQVMDNKIIESLIYCKRDFWQIRLVNYGLNKKQWPNHKHARQGSRCQGSGTHCTVNTLEQTSLRYTAYLGLVESAHFIIVMCCFFFSKGMTELNQCEPRKIKVLGKKFFLL